MAGTQKYRASILHVTGSSLLRFDGVLHPVVINLGFVQLEAMEKSCDGHVLKGN